MLYQQCPHRSPNGAQLSLSGRINDANNGFLGEVVIGVSLSYFQKSYEAVASLADKSFMLLHSDGTVIVRYPDPTDRVRQAAGKISLVSAGCPRRG